MFDFEGLNTVEIQENSLVELQQSLEIKWWDIGAQMSPCDLHK